jgi:hypothetical protein
MSILNLDGPSGRNFGKPFKVVLGIGALAAVVAIASTLAANISINSGPVEFGQGVAQTTACDDSIMVAPRSTFINTSNSETSTLRSFPVGAAGPDSIIVLPADGEFFYPGMQFYITIDGESSQIDLVVTEVSEILELVPMGETSTPTNISAPYEFLDGFSQAYEITLAQSIFGFWTLAEATVGASGFQFSGVDVSDIDATEGKCRGKTFTLKAYGETETAALAEYSVYVGETVFLSANGSIESTNPGTSSSSFSLDFNAPRISASSVYKITIESSDMNTTLLDGRTFNLAHIGALMELDGETQTPLSAECSNGVCTADYVRLDYINEIGIGGPSENLQIFLEMNPSGTADKKWAIRVGPEGETPDEELSSVSYGYIKYFNGTFGLITITEDPTGAPPDDADAQVVFSTRGALPVTVPGEYEGTLTWSYPSESRYTE